MTTFTEEQHWHAVTHVLAIVDEMIRRHESFKRHAHQGLCGTRYDAIAGLYWQLPQAKQEQIQKSMQRMMERHIMPNGARLWWFGERDKAGWKRRRDALDVLRAKVAAGDIHPNPLRSAAHDNSYALAA